ncbi:hypothetical protein MPTK2_1g20270 [Marchantia polymorpha subsp. ruderalis]
MCCTSAHSPEDRNVPVDWRDDGCGPSLASHGPSIVTIEELADDVTQQLPPSHAQAMVDDEIPSTASSVFRTVGEHSGARIYAAANMNPDFNPNAPRTAEVPVMSNEDGLDIEEEMLRAAIEASRREAEEANRRSAAPPQEVTGGNPVERFPVMRSTEDDDLARAVTLSLKTAELEKAMRERVGASSESAFMQEDEDIPSIDDVRRRENSRRPVSQRIDLERSDWMEEDDPAIDIPIRPTAPSAPPNPFVPGPLNPWEVTEYGLPLVGRPIGPVSRGSAPRVSHPPDVRNVPIDWRDDDNSLPLPTYGPSTLRIEELADDDTQQLPPSHAQAMVDDEVPSTASSGFRTIGEQSGARRYPTMPYPGANMNPDFNPNAPRIAEVPVMSNEDGIDIEEEMLRAAIEASRREAEEANRRSAASSQEVTGGNPVERFPVMRSTEDDDLARAVTLSLKTAELEKAMRERVGASSDSAFMQEDEDNPSIDDVRRLDSMRRRGIARDRTGMARGGGTDVGATSSGRDKGRVSGSSSGAIVSSAPDDIEEVEEQPLLRRRTTRRSTSITAEPMVVPDEGEARAQSVRGVTDQRDSSVVPNARITSSGDEGPATAANAPSQHDVDPFPSDEWGGISSEEHDEAVMLEAALFGGLPEGSGLGLPYHARRGIHTDVLDDIAGGESAGLMAAFNRRGFPQPPSPTVVAQRLLREQQDDEYLASLAADREKELRAIQEAEAQRVREQEAAAAAESEEQLRREEEKRQKEEAEELERQLTAKKGKLPMEPAADAEGAVTLVVRLPDGSRRGRRFHKSNKLQNLFDFIDVGGAVKPGSYRLVRQFPRVAFTDGEHASSLESLGLTSKQEVLLLELI